MEETIFSKVLAIKTVFFREAGIKKLAIRKTKMTITIAANTLFINDRCILDIRQIKMKNEIK